jgi:hypothetical protein
MRAIIIRNVDMMSAQEEDDLKSALKRMNIEFESWKQM